MCVCERGGCPVCPPRNKIGWEKGRIDRKQIHIRSKSDPGPNWSQIGDRHRIDIRSNHQTSPTLSRLALQFTNRNLQETSYSAGRNKCKCFSWTFCASSLDIRSSSSQKLAHVKLAHTQRTQKPTQWAKTALESKKIRPICSHWLANLFSKRSTYLILCTFCSKRDNLGCFCLNCCRKVKPEAKTSKP